MDLITLEEYKSYNALSANPKDDARYSFLISSVSALIQTYLGIDFAGGKTITETISLDYDTDTIYLDKYPVANIVSVQESDRYTYDSTVHVPLVYASDYRLDADNGILTRLYRVGGFANWTVGPGSIVVTYTTAAFNHFSPSNLPADLKLAVIELVNYYKNEEFRQAKTIQGSSVINTLAQGDNDFPRHIQVILDRYAAKYK